MSDLIINGTTYSGSPTNTGAPQRPSTYNRKRNKIGRLFKAANGAVAWVHRGFKDEWTIGWEKANTTTAGAVLALYNLTTSFAFVDINGNSHTVVTVGDDQYSEDVTSNRSNAYLYDLQIVLRQV